MKKKRTKGLFRRLVEFVLVSALVVGLLLACWLLYQLRDRNPGYSVRLNIDGSSLPVEQRNLRVGFGKVDINPDLSDTNNPVWIAGFSQGRAATAIHDDIYALACVVDDGKTRVAFVALDAIGFMHDDVIDIRAAIPADWKIDYCLVASTHNHSVPDLMGIWGKEFYLTGVDPKYMAKVKASSVSAIEQAVKGLQATKLELHDIPTPNEGLVKDTRKPEVFDPGIRMLLFRDAEGKSVLGSVVSWSNHPETLWADNTEITADFIGYFRETLGAGIPGTNGLFRAGLGGTHVFINGAVGGLLAPHPSITIRDPETNEEFAEPSHAKARALGHQLSRIALDAIKEGKGLVQEQPAWSLKARTFELPLANPVFYLASLLGVIDRGHSTLGNLRTEAAVLRLGDATLAAIPGEIYPEIVNGGIESPAGADFGIEPVEVPPIREFLPGKVKFIVGLANDEIGYIVPKSEWDEKKPYLYNAERPVYGEINSLGPETAPLLHQILKELAQ